MWQVDWWLPANISWEHLPSKREDLIYPLYFALPILLFRILWESFVGITLGHFLGFIQGPLLPNCIQHCLGGFAKNTRQKRVLECFWRFSYYTVSFAYGVYVLWDKSWLWDVKDCWIGYPYHPVDESIWWYYMIETSFYYSLLLASVFDVKRSDFWQLVFHHIVTIGLLSVSWTINFVRVGSLVLISHDVADVFLEGGKLVRYNKHWKTATTASFVLFMISWIITRLGFYPFVVIRSAVFEAAGLIQPDYEIFDPFQKPYVPRIIILMLCALLCLHIFWTVIIVKIVVKTITDGETVDVRSDNEEDDEDIEERKAQELRKKKKLHRKAD